MNRPMVPLAKCVEGAIVTYHRLRRWARQEIHPYHLLSTTAGRAFLCSAFLWLGLVSYCSRSYARDPTSAFFNPDRGYERIYSLHRQHQAETFVQAANTTPVGLPTDGDSSKGRSGKSPNMCIGVATVERPTEQYIRPAFGSLIEGLSSEDRNQLHTIVLIAHTDPQQHPGYREPWLAKLSDQVLLYDSAQKEQFDDLKKMEEEKDYRRKAIFDYTYLLNKCVDT
ncbi:MAG: hypothetical protein Q9183_003082, partial [Haloplaca sp. 2 TL-2023]